MKQNKKLKSGSHLKVHPEAFVSSIWFKNIIKK